MMGAGAVVLVDFESVQNIDFSQLAGSRLVVFAGEVQRKVPIEVAMGLQALGERARWVRSSGVGPNALDFHIAFEIGRMVEKGEKGPCSCSPATEDSTRCSPGSARSIEFLRGA